MLLINPCMSLLKFVQSYMFKDMSKICSELTIKIQKGCLWRRSGVFIVNGLFIVDCFWNRTPDEQKNKLHSKNMTQFENTRISIWWYFGWTSIFLRKERLCLISYTWARVHSSFPWKSSSLNANVALSTS